MSARNPIRGFTLIELLVVISIIAILAVIGITVFTGVQKSARDTKRRADIHAIQLAIEQYKLDNGVYPAANGSIGRAGWGDSDLNPTDYIAGLSSYFAGGALPIDPVNNSTYHYSYALYPSAEYGCDSSRYYVVGARAFEASTTKIGGWKCSGTWSSGPRDWSNEFFDVVGNYQ